jgi:hypothetical protein
VRKTIVPVAASVALTLGGIGLLGCQNSNHGPGTMTETGGGSRDVYGDNNTDRYKIGGNIGKDTPAFGSTPATGINDHTSGTVYGGNGGAATSAGSTINGTGATTTGSGNVNTDNGTGTGGIGTSTPPAPARPPGTGLGGPNGVGSGGASNPNQNGNGAGR